MRATAPLPEASVGARPPRARAGAVGSLLGRHRLELVWGAFVAACLVAMFAWPSWQTVPFFLIWISLTLLYGLKVWPLRPTLVVLVAVMVLTGIPTATHAMGGTDAVQKLAKVPLMALLFLAVVWHARRRVEALRIAERRAAEANSMLERQERFIHDASHELRTPLTIARGHLELLGENPQASGAKAPPLGAADQFNVDIALDELSRIDAIVARLLLLASAGQPDFLQSEDVDLEPFLEVIFMRWSEVARRAWRLGTLVPGRLRVDPDRLRAALDALLENAVKFTQEGELIELRTAAGAPGQIAIEVADEGCGVQPQALDRIFDRFGRADAARSRSDGGVGLGLAIVDAIAKRHGGRCSVSSASHGSTFALLLPGFTPASRGTAAAGSETRKVLTPGDGSQSAAALSSSRT
jgi:signal transduction histidine kinase